MPALVMSHTASRIKESVASILPGKNKLNVLSAESLLRMLAGGGKSGYLRHRCHGTFPMRNSWKQRFVILADSAVYIYDQETSKCPRGCLALLGYNRVHRIDSGKPGQWGFAIASAGCSGSGSGESEEERFHCSSEQERLEWMRMVKGSLYKANNVVPRKQSLIGQLTLEYELLEEPIFEVKVKGDSTSSTSTTTTTTTTSPGGQFQHGLRDSVFVRSGGDDGVNIINAGVGGGVDDDDDEDESDHGGGYGWYSDEEERYEVGIWCRLKRKGAVKRRNRRHGVSSVTQVVDSTKDKVTAVDNTCTGTGTDTGTGTGTMDTSSD